MKQSPQVTSRVRRWVVLCSASALLITGCSHESLTSPANDPYRLARIDNLNRHVSSEFEARPEVIADRDGSGVEVSRKFFDSSDTVVVSSGDVADQVRAASVAVVSHAPMLTMTNSTRSAVIAEIGRLGARYVLEVGDVPLASGGGDQIRIKDPGGIAALGEMTALQFYPRAISYPTSVIRAVAELEPEEVAYLIPAWDEQTYREALEKPSRRDTSREEVVSFPAQSKRDADMAPLVIASEQSSVAGVATARAYGATVRSMPYPDPRFTRETMEMVAGLADQPLIALGAQFGTAQQLSEKIRLGEEVVAPVAGGGGLMFPGRTVVAVNANAFRRNNTDNKPHTNADLIEHSKNQQAAVARMLDGRFSNAVVVDFGIGKSQSSKDWEDKKDQILAVARDGGIGIVSVTPVAGEVKDQLRELKELLLEPNVSVMLDLSAASELGTGISDTNTGETDSVIGEDEDTEQPKFKVADPRIRVGGFAGSQRSDDGTTPHDLGTDAASSRRPKDGVQSSGDNAIALTPDEMIYYQASRSPAVLEAREVNQASGYIAELIKTYKLPQKAFIIAQNAPGMVDNINYLSTTSSHLAFTVLAQLQQGEIGERLSWEQAKQAFGRTVDDYRQLGREIFYGWGTSDLNDGLGLTEGEASSERSAEFTKLSPRPWLIIND